MAQKDKNRKVRAVLAGGLVLGVGAAVTLAAWNSSEFAFSMFGTGNLVLEGSLDGDAFAHHPETNQAELTFSLNQTNLSPGEVVSAPFAVRLTQETTFDAAVTLNTNFGTNLEGLKYRVFSTAAFGCEPAEGADIVASTPLITGEEVGTFDLLKSGAVDEPGTTINLCFEVTAGPQSVLSAGESSTAVWNFVAVQKN